MKIFAAGDLHGDSALAKELAEKAKEGGAELVLLCGDLTHRDQQADYLIGPFKARNLNVAFVHGNHDSFATAGFFSEFYYIKNLHRKGIKYNRFGFFGVGGANIGLERLTEDELFEALKYGFESVNYLDKKIMVTHVHPANCQIENFTSLFPGSAGVTKAINEFSPDLVLCSHVHEADGIEDRIGKTRIINVGRSGKLLDLQKIL
ncbi:MAG: metallophosphoesterase family protein [Nanoarchaeota archaeon]